MRLTIAILCSVVAYQVITADHTIKVCKLLGDQIVMYNLTTHNCSGGKLSPIVHPTLETTTTTTTTETTTDITMATEPNKSPCLDPAHVTTCTGQKLCKGYKCCGTSKTYHPDFSTCCVTMIDKAEVHTNKPEKDHVCCDLKAFKRGSQTCLHPAGNDALWTPKAYKYLRQSSNCYKLVYVVLNLKQTRDKKSGIDAYIKLKQVLPKPRSGEGIIVKPVKLDKYSPKRNITVSKTLLVTNHDRSATFTFNTFSNDEIYTVPG